MFSNIKDTITTIPSRLTLTMASLLSVKRIVRVEITLPHAPFFCKLILVGIVNRRLDFNPTQRAERFVPIARQLYSVLARINDQHTSMRVLVDR